MTDKPNVDEGLTRIWAFAPANPSDVTNPDSVIGGKVSLGWDEEFPPFQFFNWLDRFTTTILAHINEHGTPVWDAETNYPVHGRALSITNGRTYRCIATPNINNDPDSSPAFWLADDGGKSTFYSDSSANDAYVVSNVDPFSVPDSYIDGMEVRFVPNVGAAGTATINVDGLGVKNIVDETGNTTVSSRMPSGRIAELWYDEFNDRFVVRQSYAPDASETVAGLVEKATQTETNAGSDDFRFVTPLKLENRTATESRSGLAELATQAQVTAGTDDERIVTPLKLQQRTFAEVHLGEVILPTASFTTIANGNTNVFVISDIPIGTYRMRCFVSGNLVSAPTTEEVNFFFTTSGSDINFSVKATSTVLSIPEYKHATNSLIAFDNDVVASNSTQGTGDVFFEANGIITMTDVQNLNLVANTDGIAFDIHHAMITFDRVENFSAF